MKHNTTQHNTTQHNTTPRFVLFLMLIAGSIFTFTSCDKESDNLQNADTTLDLESKELQDFVISEDMQESLLSPCLTTAGFTGCNSITSYYEIITVQPYGCEMTVPIQYITCTDPSTGQVSILITRGVEVLTMPLSQDCFDWWDNLSTLPASQYTQLFANYQNDIDQEVIKNVVNKVLNERPGQFDCESESFVQSFFYSAACVTMCEYYPHSSTPGNPPIYFKADCATDGCCSRTSSHCRLSNGNISSTTPVFTQLSDCEEFIPNPCAPGAPFHECLLSCGDRRIN